ncbi:MAG: DUF285 domain-containing protein, partial [Bacilli bacterium]|nr:DUF285 domain-containing protein [Bacilli bacterium]
MSTKDTYQMNEEYFQMPEQDVVLRAEWSKLTLVKSLDGNLHITNPPIMQAVSSSYNEEMWKYKDSITKIVFQDDIREIMNAQESWDISDAKNGSVMGRLVVNDESTDTYTVYIQGDGGVIANPSSNYLFSNFSKLETIENLTYLDTSRVGNMEFMFRGCSSLKSLDLSNFNTAKVRYMGYMFSGCKSLTELDFTS